jgi:uncharacterized membrane protein
MYEKLILIFGAAIAIIGCIMFFVVNGNPSIPNHDALYGATLAISVLGVTLAFEALLHIKPEDENEE